MTKSLQQVTCTNEIGPAIIIVPCAFVFMKVENTFSQAATSQKLPGYNVLSGTGGPVQWVCKMISEGTKKEKKRRLC
jgi:hypothetical protein